MTYRPIFERLPCTRRVKRATLKLRPTKTGAALLRACYAVRPVRQQAPPNPPRRGLRRYLLWCVGDGRYEIEAATRSEARGALKRELGRDTLSGFVLNIAVWDPERKQWTS